MISRKTIKAAGMITGTILVIALTNLYSLFIGSIFCTAWIIVLIIHYGMKGGLAFTGITAVSAFINYLKVPTYDSTLFIMGVATYLCMSLGIGIPIDLMRREQTSRKASEERLRRITDNIQDVIIQMNRGGIIHYISPSCMKVFGKTSEYFLGKSFFEEIHPEDRQSITKRIEEAFSGESLSLMEYRYGENSGNYIWMESLGQIICDEKNDKSEIVLNCRNITERKKTEETIIYLSYHDTLTGLYNRAFFESIQKRLLEQKILPLSIIIGDVNGLKLTNDVFGHYEGDCLLVKAANILSEVCRKEDIAVRWGGDEFALLLPGVDETSALDIMQLINKKCSEASSEPIKVSIALGHGTKHSEEESLQDVIKTAEERMYHNKLLKSSSVRNEIISSLEDTLLERSCETKEHIDRITENAKTFSLKLGLSQNEIKDLMLLAALHDVGKISVSNSILTRPGGLNEREWDEIRKHPEVGYRIALSTKELSGVAHYILTHHERWDGTGYPQGLKGESIPKLSRIISILDAYTAMTGQRFYKAAMTNEEALEEIVACAGTQFDPELANAFAAMMKPRSRS